VGGVLPKKNETDVRKPGSRQASTTSGGEPACLPMSDHSSQETNTSEVVCDERKWCQSLCACVVANDFFLPSFLC